MPSAEFPALSDDFVNDILLACFRLDYASGMHGLDLEPLDPDLFETLLKHGNLVSGLDVNTVLPVSGAVARV